MTGGRMLLAALLLLAPSAQARPLEPHPEHAWLKIAQDVPDGAAQSIPALDPARAAELEAAGHGAADVLWRFEIELQAGGRAVYRTTQVRQFLSDAGVSEGGNLQFSVSADRQRAEVEAAFSLGIEGASSHVAPATVQVQTSAEADVFSDLRSVVLPFTGLRPGSRAVVIHRTIQEGGWPLPWSRLLLLQWVLPIERLEVLLRWQPGVAEPRWEGNAPDLRCEKTGPREARCTREQVPALQSDSLVESYLDLMPRLLVSEPQTWRELASRELELVDAAATVTPTIETRARELVSSAESPADRLARLHRFVSDEVRYVGLEHGESAIRPHPASLTLSRRYGDCKDKVTLFLALARAAGLDAHPVLAATDRYALEQLSSPSWLYFNHMIACVRGLEGGEVCVDLTDPTTPTGALPASLHGAVALDLVPGVDAPRRLPSPEHTVQINVQVKTQVGCDGSIIEQAVRSFEGSYGAALRGALQSLVVEDRQRWARQDYASVMGDRVTPEVTLAGIESGARALRVETRTDFTGIADYSRTSFVAESDYWLRYYGLDFRGKNERHPYPHQGVRIESEVEYVLCPPTRVTELGPTLELEAEYGSVRRTYTKTPTGVRINTELSVPRTVIPASAMQRFNRFLEAAVGQSRVWFSVTRSLP